MQILLQLLSYLLACNVGLLQCMIEDVSLEDRHAGGRAMAYLSHQPTTLQHAYMVAPTEKSDSTELFMKSTDPTFSF